MIRNTGKVLYAAGVLCAVVFVIENGRLEWPHLLDHGFGIAAAVAPALSLLLSGFMEKMGYEEQLRNYENMQTIFSRASRRFSEASGHFGRRSQILNRLGLEAIAETTSWVNLKKARMPSVLT